MARELMKSPHMIFMENSGSRSPLDICMATKNNAESAEVMIKMSRLTSYVLKTI